MEEKLRARAQAELSPAKFRHVEGVVETARELARQFGAEEDQAVTAAWLHDLAREWPQEKLLSTAYQVQVHPQFFGQMQLLHGPIAAAMTEEWFGVKDEDVENAVRYHTTGRVGMSVLEKVVWLADAIEPGRSYPGVENIRAMAKTDLNRAVAEAMDGVILYLLQSHGYICSLTVEARNDLWRSCQ